MIATPLRILPLTTIVRNRLLPLDGEVKVRAGQKVSASDVVAEARLNTKHLILDVSAELEIPPARADAALKVKRGQKVSKGDAVAETGGMFGREALAPVDGLVVVTGGGKIVLERGGATLSLPAGISGTVTQIIENRGVSIRASGALVQGAWGNGKVDAGILASLINQPDDTLETNQLDVSLRGSILLAGHVSSLKTLQAAAELLVRGLILASLDANLASAAAQAPYPILLLEGFGRRPMSAAAFKLLSTNLKREVSLLAEARSARANARPEVFISVTLNQEPPEPRDVEMFAAGQAVKINWLARPAQFGVITQIFPLEKHLPPAGVIALAAAIRLENGETITAPLSNLEALG